MSQLCPTKKLPPKIMVEYIYPYISSNDFLMSGKTKMTGTGGLQRLPVQYVSEFEVPLPSLDIQQEIVDTIEADMEGY
ncbi:hypothetical protein AGMMS49928_23230 [Spirochaetia bacterium]|nr:hypothetical protein AGMMS49928_23230 [Spirochaetia bacterium]